MSTKDRIDQQPAESDQRADAGATAIEGGRRRHPLIALAHNTWRGLTSMRTALILLFLLALASIPGALLPQWSLNRSRTAAYIEARPTWGKLLNSLGFFEVFAAPWYAAIYLLLFVSLIGCLLPRTLELIRQLRAEPVRTPRNLNRLPLHAEYTTDDGPAEHADRIVAALRARRWRVADRSAAEGVREISAEKGYLREVGNLVFHFALLGLLLSIAAGKLFGYEGSVLVQKGQQFCSVTPAQYDNFRPGLRVDGTSMTPFCLQVKDFQADFTAAGMPTAFLADVDFQTGEQLSTADSQEAELQVNHPLRFAGERLYLLGHGYAPRVTVTFPNGEQRTKTVNFVPSGGDPMFLSEGAIKFADPPGVPNAEVKQHQLAIVGVFAPTAVMRGALMSSGYPALERPGLAVDIYRGDLGMEDGAAQSVYGIDERQVERGALVKLARVNLFVGDEKRLDDGTVIRFDGATSWVSLQTSYDPGQTGALLSSAAMLLGLLLSLGIKRRRVWFRVQEASPTVVSVGGLARTDQAGYGEEFDRLAGLARDHEPVAAKE